MNTSTVIDRTADEATFSNNKTRTEKMPLLYYMRTIREIKWALHYAGGSLEVRRIGRTHSYVPHLPQDKPEERDPHGVYTRKDLIKWANNTSCGTFNPPVKRKRIEVEVDTTGLPVHT